MRTRFRRLIEKLLPPVLLPLALGSCSMLPAGRTANDIARELCAMHYSQAEGMSLDDAARVFCQDLRPWLDYVLKAQKDGVGGPDKCDAPDAGAEASADAAAE